MEKIKDLILLAFPALSRCGVQYNTQSICGFALLADDLSNIILGCNLGVRAERVQDVFDAELGFFGKADHQGSFESWDLQRGLD